MADGHGQLDVHIANRDCAGTIWHVQCNSNVLGLIHTNFYGTDIAAKGGGNYFSDVVFSFGCICTLMVGKHIDIEFSPRYAQFRIFTGRTVRTISFRGTIEFSLTVFATISTGDNKALQQFAYWLSIRKRKNLIAIPQQIAETVIIRSIIQ